MAEIELGFVTTQDLINELHRRSRVFFCAQAPLNEGEGYSWSAHYSVDGGKSGFLDAVTRAVGLADVARESILHGYNAAAGTQIVRGQEEEEKDDDADG